MELITLLRGMCLLLLVHRIFLFGLWVRAVSKQSAQVRWCCWRLSRTLDHFHIPAAASGLCRFLSLCLGSFPEAGVCRVTRDATYAPYSRVLSALMKVSLPWDTLYFALNVVRWPHLQAATNVSLSKHRMTGQCVRTAIQSVEGRLYGQVCCCRFC